MQDFDNNCPYTPEEAAKMLRDISEAYFYLLSGAEKFNTITAAHKHHLGNALDRANNTGKVIDQLVKVLAMKSKPSSGK